LGGVLNLDTAWRLAKAWYHDRLDPNWQRKTPEETQALFADLGMTESFWKLNW
jgi:hypothetical protein